MIQALMKWKSWRLALLSGLLLGFSFPPFKLGFLAWVSLVPFLRVLLMETPWRSAWFGFIAGFSMNIVALHWLAFNIGAPPPVAFLSMVAAGIYLALFWAIISFIFSWTQSISGTGLMLFPFVWVAMEYIMSIGPMGFPWVSLSTTQVDYLPPIQLAEWTGIFGITFWVITINVILYGLVTSIRKNWMSVVRMALVVVVSVWLLGYLRLASLSDGYDLSKVKVSVVQPNIGPHEKWEMKKQDWVFSHLDSLYMIASQSKPDMIIWPEAALPTFLTKNHSRLMLVRQRIRQTGIPLLTGTIDWSSSGKQRVYYNSVAFIKEDGKIPVYHKNQLVPLGEFNPFSRQIPSSEELNLGHYTRGEEKTIFQLKESFFASIICFESVFPRLVRRLTNVGAQFLVIVVNDGWYGSSSELYQHKAIARLRAIEHRYPVVRSANTGISTIIDRSGREITTLGVGKTGVITASIGPVEGQTFYGHYGEWIVFVSLLSILFIGIRGWRKANS